MWLGKPQDTTRRSTIGPNKGMLHPPMGPTRAEAKGGRIATKGVAGGRSSGDVQSVSGYKGKGKGSEVPPSWGKWSPGKGSAGVEVTRENNSPKADERNNVSRETTKTDGKKEDTRSGSPVAVAVPSRPSFGMRGTVRFGNTT